MQTSELAIVGLAAGNLDYLTLNGLSFIKDADVIVHDTGLDAEIRSLWSAQTRSIVLPQVAVSDEQHIEAEARLIVESIRGGQRVVRLSLDQPHLKKRLEAELKILKRLGVRQRIVPSLYALQKEAWDLRLPWLSELIPTQFRIIQSTSIRGDGPFWKQLAIGSDTLAIDLGQGKLHNFIDRLLLAGADPDRPVALVSHHPTQNPICWLTTLEEVDELLPQWKPQGATIVYIGTWPHAVRDSETNKNFWGSLETAAENWLRAQRA